MAAPVGPKKVYRYTVEFKIQAVKLAQHPEIQTQDVAHFLAYVTAQLHDIRATFWSFSSIAVLAMVGYTLVQVLSIK